MIYGGDAQGTYVRVCETLEWRLIGITGYDRKWWRRVVKGLPQAVCKCWWPNRLLRPSAKSDQDTRFFG
jgi:hypothetical protein